MPNWDFALPPVDLLRQLATNYSRRSDEADDLVQDLLLEIVKTGREITDMGFMPGHTYIFVTGRRLLRGQRDAAGSG